jgi:hypothetical protein
MVKQIQTVAELLWNSLLNPASGEPKKGSFPMKMSSIPIGIITAVLVIGCGGRPPNPVMIQQFGDDRKSCPALEREMSFIQGEIQRLVPQTEKTGKNVALGVTGFFFLVPLLFMDLSQAEQIEVDAYRQRYNHLLIIAGDKNCGIEGEEIPEFTTRADH